MTKKYEFGKIKYSGTNDYVAKKIWSNPKNFKNLVYKTLGITLDEEKIEYTTNEDKKEVTGKGNQYDVIVKYGQDMNMLVETQCYGSDNKEKYSDYMINRSIHYVSSSHCMLYEENDNYKINKYTYLIWVCTFETPNENGISVFSFFDGIEEFDRVKIVFVSLPNIKKDAKINSKTKDFFNVLDSKDLSSFEESDSEVIELAKTINKANTDSDDLYLAELAEMKRRAILTEIEMSREEGREIGLTEGREQGMAEGREQGMADGQALTEKKLVINMHKNGATPEEISRLLGFELSKVLEILK